MTAAVTIDNPAYFDRLAAIEAAHWWSLGMWRLASRWLDGALRGRRGLDALDAGCGTGLTAARLSRRPEIATVVGLDPSPDALRHARATHDLPLVLGSVLDLPFASESVDVITCFDVLQHLPRGGDRRAASELRRVLRPGGVAVVRSNAIGWSSELGGDAPRCYRLGALVDVFERAGFVVRRASYANCLPAMAQEVRGRLARRDPAHPVGGGLRIRVPPPWINRLLRGVSETEAAVAGRLGVRLPFGHSTMILAGVRKLATD
jgi:SAM-dependent methyltransferase